MEILRWVLKREEEFAQVSSLSEGERSVKASSCITSNNDATRKVLGYSPFQK